MMKALTNCGADLDHPFYAASRLYRAILLVLAGLLGISQPLPADDGNFVNLSNRGLVGEGDDVRIVGFIIEGGARQVLIQALGPELANSGVSNPLADPVLTVTQTHEGEPPRIPLVPPVELMVNDNWEDNQGQLISDLWGGSPPLTAGSLSSAVVLTLEPGGYTAKVEGKNGTVGVAIVEVFRIASDGGGTGLAPADQAAFDALFVGKQFGDSNNGLIFLSPGRIREFDGGIAYEGNYEYENAGADTGTLTYTYDVTGNDLAAEKTVIEMTFTSQLAGTFVATYTETGSSPMVTRAPFDFTEATDTMPSFATDSNPGNQTYTAGTTIHTLTLPEATGGDGALTYSLSPSVPGLSFNASTRRLSGTPTNAGTHSMTFTVTDADGDSDSLTFTISINSRGSESSDRAALTALYNATDGANWTNDANWLSDEPLEEWYGVSTNASGHVDRLTLSENALSGSIPEELGNLANLQSLYLRDNQLSGPIPAQLGNLANLEYLYLNGNQLSGCIPDGLRDVANNDLSILDLPYCGDGGQETTHGVGSTLSDLPTGSWTPDVTSGGSFGWSGDNVTISFNDGGYIEEGNFRYTCHSSGGCVIENRGVTYGTIVQATALGTALGRGILRSFKVSETSLTAGQAFTMETNVRNPGSATTLRYYRSLDATIDSSDALIHDGWLFIQPWLSDPADATAVLDWTAPAYAGTYYYGASASRDFSPGVRVTVEGSQDGSPDLMAHPSLLIPDNVTPGSRFTWSAKIENKGTGLAAATSMRRYISDDATIDATDVLASLGISSVQPMDPMGSHTGTHTMNVPDEAGTYYLGVCVDPVPGETNTENNCSVGTRLIVEERGSPDLMVRGLVLREIDRTGRKIDLLAYVLNTGDGTASETVARFYRSDDAIIDDSDTQVSTDSTGLLGTNGTIPAFGWLEMPTSPGTYYYGVCVDPVPGETDTKNNCSEPVSLNVGVSDLAFGPAWVSTSNPLAGQSFTLTAAVRNEGPAVAAATTVRYYRSDDATIDPSDTQVATGAISDLTGIDGLVLGPSFGPNRRRAAFATSREAISLNAPSSPGTYYYGACVDGVPGETDTYNNCSAGAYVRVVPSGADPFNIELIFVDDFTDARKDLMQQAARRFEAIITQGLPNVDFSSNGFDFVADGGRVTRKIEDTVDDLRIFVLKTHYGTYAGAARPDYVRTGNPTGLPAVGAIFMDSFALARREADSVWQEERLVRDLMLHEIAHVLGFGSLWQEFGLLHEPLEDTYFSGELAIRAFNAAGGEPYVGNKVPVEGGLFGGSCGSASHWNPYVFRGLDRQFGAELMEPTVEQEHALSAITIQSLADLGYVVDVRQADPYSLPATVGFIEPPTANAMPILSQEVDVGVAALGPIYVGNEQGQVIHTIEPSH